MKTKEDILSQFLTVTLPDGAIWAVPVRLIAESRSKYYANEYEDDEQRCLEEDTVPAFEDDYEIIDWATNNMNWEDFEGRQIKLKNSPPPDFQQAWNDNTAKIIPQPNPKDIIL